MRVCCAAVDILFVTPAISPYLPGTELGDVCRALAKALRGLGHRVTVLSPLYAGHDPGTHALARKLSTLDVEVGGQTRECAVLTGRTTGGVELVFVSHDATFGEHPATLDDGAARAAGIVLAKAAARYAGQLDSPPEIVHGHGFQAALAPALCKAAGIDCGCVLSLHDTTLTGTPEPGEAAGWDLPEPVATELERCGSMLAVGMAQASQSVVGSQAALTALQQTQDAESAIAIADAVDASVWNPMTDAHLEARFDPANQDGKDRCKGALQYAAELSVRPETPLLGVVGEGAEALVAELAERLLRNDVQVAVGITGDEPAEPLAALLEKHDDKLKAVDVSGEDGLHQLIGGSDLLLMTPAACAHGTAQLCAQRYGTAPIVIAGSVAAELVVDCDPELQTGNGFVYDDAAALAGTLARALSAHAETEAYQALRQRMMRIDTSWERAARRYEHVYRNALPASAEAEAEAS